MIKRIAAATLILVSLSAPIASQVTAVNRHEGPAKAAVNWSEDRPVRIAANWNSEPPHA